MIFKDYSVSSVVEWIAENGRNGGRDIGQNGGRDISGKLLQLNRQKMIVTWKRFLLL